MQGGGVASWPVAVTSSVRSQCSRCCNPTCVACPFEPAETRAIKNGMDMAAEIGFTCNRKSNETLSRWGVVGLCRGRWAVRW